MTLKPFTSTKGIGSSSFSTVQSTTRYFISSALHELLALYPSRKFTSRLDCCIQANANFQIRLCSKRAQAIGRQPMHGFSPNWQASLIDIPHKSSVRRMLKHQRIQQSDRRQPHDAESHPYERSREHSTLMLTQYLRAAIDLRDQKKQRHSSDTI